MSEELERTKKALDVALAALADLSGAENRAYTCQRCKDAFSAIDGILNPPPEFEEVEVVRWMAEDGRVFVVEEAADLHQTTLTCGEVIKLTGTVKRPVKRPVVKEVKVYMTSVDWEDTVARCFMDHPDIHGEHGELIFRYTD